MHHHHQGVVAAAVAADVEVVAGVGAAVAGISFKHLKLDALQDEMDDFVSQNQLSFTTRLMRENNWSQEYADRVINEYVDFCYIATQVDHPVTPSDEVDQCWHLHLQYCHHYHDTWLPLLGIKLYHGPTKGGHDEGVRYDTQYNQTLKSYRRIMERKPPKDIWPSARIRFNYSHYSQRVNILDNYIINKNLIHLTVLVGGIVYLILIGLIVLLLAY